MGSDSAARDVWAFGRIRELADKLDSPHADKVYIAKEYTKADLRRDLLATIPPAVTISDPRAEMARCTERVMTPEGVEVKIARADLPKWIERYGEDTVLA